MVSRLIDIEFVSASRYNIELLTGTDLTGSQLLPRWPLKPKYYVTSKDTVSLPTKDSQRETLPLLPYIQHRNKLKIGWEA